MPRSSRKRDGESPRRYTLSVTALALIAFALAALLQLGARWFGRPPSGMADGTRLASVQIVDVGQGSAALIRTASKAVLIDCGDSDHAEALCDYLHEQGVRRIHLLVLSHGHSDHIGGASAVLESFAVENVLAAQETLQDGVDFTAQRLRRRIEEEAGCRLLNPTAGQTLPLEETVSLRVLGVGVASGDENDRSLVLRLQAGERSALFPGDAEAAAELALLSEYAPAALASDLLVAGHHGSASSSGAAFLAAVRPAASAISCGRENAYGHPHAAVLTCLGEYGPCFRTDELGSLFFFTDGTNLARQTATGVELLVS